MLNYNSHEYYMRRALEEAQQAFENDEVPIGALVVDSVGTIIGKGFNRVEAQKTQCAHAELEALQQAGECRSDWRLADCTLYVTLQPCSMCYSAAVLSRIRLIVYGASSPLFGFHLDKDVFLSVYNNDTVSVIKGVLEPECAALLKNFFKKKRKEE